MKYNPEVLAPVGNMEMLEAAIKAGATGVYLGGLLYSARAYATNFDNEELKKVIKFCHKRGVKVYVTVNTLFHDSEIQSALNFVTDLYNMDVDGVIIQDLGLLHLIRKHLPNLPIHGSTQMNINNYYGAKFLQSLGFKRVVLARETPIDEIKKICENLDIEVEVFVHGSLCVGCSGQCLMSSYIGNRSGNRGRCAQPCRLDYKLLNRNKEDISKDFDSFISPKDLCTIEYVETLLNTGVNSFKIEGRMKKPEYVYNVVKSYKDKIEKNSFEKNRLKEVSLRGYTDGLIFNDFGKSYTELNRQAGKKGLEVGDIVEDRGKKSILFKFPCKKDDILILETEKNKNIPYTLKRDFKKGERVSEKYFYDLKISSKVVRSSSSKLIDEISSRNLELNNKIDFKFVGKVSEPAKLFLKYKDISIEVISENIIERANNKPVGKEYIVRSLEKLGNTDYVLEKIEILIDDDIFIPVRILNEMRREIVGKLDEEISNFNKRVPLDYVSLKQLKLSDFKDKNISVNIEENIFSTGTDNEYGDIYTENIDELSSEKFYKMPRLQFEKEFKVLNSKLKEKDFRGFLVNNLGDIQFIREEFKNKDIIGDYGLNVLNIYSYLFLKQLGIKRITLSTELNLKELNEILKYTEGDAEIIAHGPLISMIMVHCPFSVIKGCKDSSGCDSCNFNFGFMKAKNNEIFPVKRINGYTEVYHSKKLLGYNFLCDIDFRNGGNIRVINDGEKLNLPKIYFEKINGENNSEQKFDLKNYTFGHFEKGIE
ncbi:U32 family peptidase [Lagierella sp. ICN-221743]